MGGHDPQHRGRSAFVGLLDIAVVWRSPPIPGAVNGSPSGVSNFTVGADGTPYVAADDKLIALDPSDGTLAWTLDLPVPPAPERKMPSVSLGDDNSAYVVFWDEPWLVAVDFERRAVRWIYTTPFGADPPRGIKGGPMIGFDGSLYVGCVNSSSLTVVYPPAQAVSACDGSLFWSRRDEPGTQGGSIDVIGVGGEVIGGWGGGYALAPSDGSVLWTSPDPPTSIGAIYATIVGDDGAIYYAYPDTGFDEERALDPKDGHLRWSRDFSVDQHLTEPLALTVDGTLLVRDTNALIGLSLRDEQRWSLPLTNWKPVTDAAGTIYTAGSRSDGLLHLIAIRSDGTVVSDVDVGPLAYCEVVVAGRLYCTRPTDAGDGIEVMAIGR